MLGKRENRPYDDYKQLEKGLKAPGVCFSGTGVMSRPRKPSNQADKSAADSQQSADAAPDSAASLLAKLSESAAAGKPSKAAGKETPEVPAAGVIPETRFDSVAAARQAIAFHESKDASRSYLGAAISSLTSADERSLAQLKKLTADYDRAATAGNPAAAAKIKQDLEQAVGDDRKAVERQDEIAQYGSGFLKAAGLFMRGKAGLLGTAAAYALDQMNPNDPFKTQALDGGLGITKGLALKGIFHRLGQAEVGIAAKGVGLGMSSRLAEIGLTRQTYMDGNGELSGALGLGRITTGMFSKEALATDAIVFALAHGMVRGGNSITGGAIDRSPLATSMLTASSFGLLSGSSAEVHKQLSEGKSLSTMDYAAIVKKGAIQGSIDLLAGTPGGLQARAAMRPPVVSRSGQLSLVPEPGKAVESSYLSLPTDGVKTPIEDIRREGPGVFSGSKTGELWIPERDVRRVPADMLGREIAEVRSPLFAFEPLQRFTQEILRVTDNWQNDLSGKADEIASAREHYVGTVNQVKKRILSEDILNLNELNQSEFARAVLAERPDLLKTYNAYVEARDAHAAKVAELNKAVKARASELQETVDTLTDHYGLARVKVRAFDDLGGSGAQYTTGSGIVKLRNDDLYNRADTAGLVGRILHELGHSVQDTLGVWHLADSSGIGKQATAGQLEALEQLYQTRVGSRLDRTWLETVLSLRDGVHLDAGDAAHAELLMDGFRDYESPTETLIDTGNHFRITERHLNRLLGKNGGFLVVESLQRDKSGTLAEHFFGSKELPAPVRQIVQFKDRFDHFRQADWPEMKVRDYLKGLLDKRLADLNGERRAAYIRYMAGLNEREAWLIGARAKVIAERLGGTTGDTKPSADMQALHDALKKLTVH